MLIFHCGNTIPESCDPDITDHISASGHFNAFSDIFSVSSHGLAGPFRNTRYHIIADVTICSTRPVSDNTVNSINRAIADNTIFRTIQTYTNAIEVRCFMLFAFSVISGLSLVYYREPSS